MAKQQNQRSRHYSLWKAGQFVSRTNSLMAYCNVFYFFLMLHISMCTVHKTVKFWKCDYTKFFYQQDIFAICNIFRCSLGSVTQGSVFNDTLCLSHQLLTFYGCLKTSILQEQPICSWRAPIEINRAPMIPLDGGLRNTLLVFCTETLFKEDNSIHSQNPQAEHFFLSMAGG